MYIHIYICEVASKEFFAHTHIYISINTNNLHIVEWFQVFLSNMNNFQNRWNPNRNRSLSVRLNQVVMAMKESYTLFRATALEPHYQMQFSIISKTPLILEERGSYSITGDTVSAL